MVLADPHAMVREGLRAGPGRSRPPAMRRGWLPRVRPLLTAWFVVAAACEQPAETGLPGGVSFLEQDSAGVLVATTLGSRARAPIGWVVDTVPEYQIGAVAGEDPHLFLGIDGARRLPDGRVLVVDGTSCELRFFGTDGAFLGHTGGSGEGPGEFHPNGSCILVPSPGTDSLVVFDGRGLNYFDDRGRFGHRVRVPWPSNITMVPGVAGGVVGLESGGGIWASPAGHGEAHPPTFVDYGLLELGSGRVMWEEQGFQWMQDFTVVVPDSPYVYAQMAVPFDIWPAATLDTGGLYLTLGEDQGPEILQHDSSGLRRVIRLAEADLAPSPRDLRELVEFGFAPYEMADTTRERLVEYRLRLYRQNLRAKIIPVFSRLMVDEAGLLWAKLYRWQVRAPVRWLVFAPNGEGLGSVDMPPDLDVRQIGGDFVLGVWEDELGVEYVRRHALTGRR